MNYEGLKFSGSDNPQKVMDAMVVERPLKITINDEAFTVTLRMPGQEQELAVGLLYAEDIIKNISKLTTTFTETEEGIDILDVSVPSIELKEGYLNSRNFLSVSSCGICGKTELPNLEGKTISSTLPKINHHQMNLKKMFDEMKQHQLVFNQTGGCHAASAFNIQGKMLSCQEDIGRHNAVDKVVGDLLLKNHLKEAHILLVSGRVSYEIIIKTFRANIPILAAVSAPSSLAIDYAKELGIQLIGFCRDHNYTVYS